MQSITKINKGHQNNYKSLQNEKRDHLENWEEISLQMDYKMDIVVFLHVRTISVKTLNHNSMLTVLASKK